MTLIPPTINHLSRIYYELAKIGARSVGFKKPWPYHPANKEELFVLAADFSRFDPRLLELLIHFGMKNWSSLSPQKLRGEMKKMQTPQTLGVITAFIQTANPADEELTLFWGYVTEKLKPVEPQFYFRDLYSPGGRLAKRAVAESLAEYTRWGFFARERIIIDPTTKKSVGTWEQPQRLNILKRLFRQRKELQISDYLEELENSISRQQALLDLKSLKAKPLGQGRSSSWILKGP